jgi:hypothetical protein
MSEVVKFKVSSTVAAFVRPGVPVEKKLAGIQTAPLMEPFERLTLIFCLLKDAEPAVKEAAVAAFSVLPGEVVLSYVQASDAHPFLLNELARVHYADPDVAQALLGRGLLSDQAREFLQRRHLSAPVPPESPALVESAGELDDDLPTDDVASADDDLTDVEGEGQEDAEGEDQEEDAAEIDEEDEQYLSKYKIALIMGIGEKIKMALTGDKEWRAILIKDANKLVSAGVIKNARITDGEILNILKVGVQNDEIVRLICANKEWVKNYLIRKALITCPKTPLPNALRYLATMNEKDLAGYAKSKNISSVLSTQAKRMILAKKR